MIRMEYQPLLRGSSMRSKVSRMFVASEDGSCRKILALTLIHDCNIFLFSHLFLGHD